MLSALGESNKPLNIYISTLRAYTLIKNPLGFHLKIQKWEETYMITGFGFRKELMLIQDEPMFYFSHFEFFIFNNWILK